MPRSAISPLTAFRTAVIAASRQSPMLATMQWFTDRAHDAPLYVVWDTAAEDELRDAIAFRRDSVTLQQEFSLFAKPTAGRTGQEIASTAYAAFKRLVHGQKLIVVAEPDEAPLALVRCTVRLVLMIDDPDVPGLAHAVIAIRATLWSD